MCRRSFFRSITLGLIVFSGGSLRAWSAPDPPYLVLQTGPEESVTSVAVSADGSLVATGSFDGRVRIYDAHTGALRRVIGSDPSRGVRALAFAPDGATIASGGLEMDKTLKFWDVRTGALVRSAAAGHDTMGQLYAEIHAVAFAPGGKLVASAGRDGRVVVWDVEAGRVRHRLDAHRGAALSLAFAPGGGTLASGGEDRVIRLWDLASGRLIRALEGHRDSVCALAFAPDGNTLASGDTDWAYHRGRDTSRFTGPDPGHRGEWRLWDAATGTPRRTVTEPGRVSSLAFAPDGQSLACGVGRAVRLYDVASETPGRTVASHDGAVTSLAFAPDGKALISGSHDRTARRVSLPAGAEAWRSSGYWQQVNSVAISRDGLLIAAGSSDNRFAQRKLKPGAQGLGPGAVRLWDARTGRLLRRLGDPAEQVMAVAFSPDGQLVASAGAGASGSGAIRLWDSATGAPVWSTDDRAAEALAIVFAPDGSSLATADADGLIKLRDPRTGSVVRTLEGHEGGATSVAFSGDGAIVCGGGADEGAYLWEARTGRAIRTIRATRSPRELVHPGHERLITFVALSADGGTLVTCSGSASPVFGDRQVRVWDAHTGQLRREFSRPQSAGRFLALSPDRITLATSGSGKAIALWDVRTGRLVRELVGHPHPAQSATFSADGRLLVSGADYRTTKVWEVATGHLLATMVTFSESQAGPAADDWLAYTPEGFYESSPGIDLYLAWRVGDDLRAPGTVGLRLHRPDRLEAALKPPRSEPDSH
jgi:WD40 repeat protein